MGRHCRRTTSIVSDYWLYSGGGLNDNGANARSRCIDGHDACAAVSSPVLACVVLFGGTFFDWYWRNRTSNGTVGRCKSRESDIHSRLRRNLGGHAMTMVCAVDIQRALELCQAHDKGRHSEKARAPDACTCKSTARADAAPNVSHGGVATAAAGGGGGSSNIATIIALVISAIRASAVLRPHCVARWIFAQSFGLGCSVVHKKKCYGTRTSVLLLWKFGHLGQ